MARMARRSGGSQPSTPGCVIGCDIGGTFTDLVCWDPGVGLRVFKLLTTPAEPSEAFLDGVRHFGTARAPVLDRTGVVLHGTTLAANAIIERKGSRTALLTTAGFRDVVEIRRERRYDMHDIFLTFPLPLVPRRRRFEIAERILSDGSVEKPIDEAEIRSVAEQLPSQGVQSVAISFLHSYANPAHEEAAAAVLGRALPGVSVTVSSRLLPEIGEFERTSTAVANAYIKPLMAAYLERLDARLREEGFTGRLYIVLSNGGLTSSAAAAEYPIRVVESGPAAGAMGAEILAQRLGIDRLFSFDMGGTTAKACIIRDGRLSRAYEFEVARESRFKPGSGIALRVPVVDLLEIGAGGGSTAAPDAMGLLAVGPESAGADPGPACYARGGTEATVTDADLVLGYLDPRNFLGGRMSLDVGAAERALADRVAKPLGLSVLHAAWAVHDLVNENMAAAARVHFAEKAEESEGFSLAAFGGAGPVHAVGLAWKLGVRHVIVPVSPGIFSALSFLAAPMIYEAVRTYKVRLSRFEPAALEALVNEMLAEAARFLEQPRLSEPDWDLSIDMRYAGQGYNVVVPLGRGGHTEADIARAFDAVYEKLYGRVLADVEREIINVRLAARRAVLGLTLPGPGQGATAPRCTERLAYDPLANRLVPFKVAKRRDLTTGSVLEGPCIVEEDESTTVLPYAGRLTVDDEGNLHIELAGADR